MPAILIRDVTEEMHKRLKERAAANRRSLGREALVLLEGALENRGIWPSLEKIDSMRVKPRKPMTREYIREAIRKGRS